MRLILKHLFRTIRQRPTQPLILTLTLVLAVIVSLFSLTVDTMILSEIRLNTEDQYGNSDFVVSLGADSESRFMFSSEVEELLGDRVNAIGTFELAAFVGDEGRAAFAVATELDKISNFFDFRFTDISPITPSSAGECVFISADFAEEYSLSLGDRVDLEIGRVKKSYTVSGISDTKFMASFDLMLDIVGVMRVLTSTSPTLAPMGDAFKPGGKIYVDTVDGTTDECIALLLKEDSFSDKVITRVEVQFNSDGGVYFISIPMRISVLLSLILSAAVTFTCFYILSTEREEENLVLSAAGAGRRRLNSLQYIEVVIYLLIGGGIGLLLSIPLAGLISDFAGFRYADSTVTLKNIAFSELGMLLTLIITVTIFICTPRLSGGKAHGRVSEIIPIIFGGGYIISYLLVMLLPPDNTLIPLIVSICLILPLILQVSPRILQSICKRLDAVGNSFKTSLRYAIKNVIKVKILHNTARLVAVTGTISIVLSVVMLSYYGSVETGASLFKGDYAVLGATDRCHDGLSSAEGVESVSSVFYSREKVGEVLALVVSTDNIDVLSDKLEVDQLPKGNGAIISRTYANMLSIDLGDSFSVEIAGRTLQFEVAEIVKSSTPVLLIDGPGLGIANNLFIVDGKADVSDAELFEELSFVTALEMVAITPIPELLNDAVSEVRICLRACVLLLVIAVIFAFIGIIDNLVESYRARRGEFELYRLAGMSPAEIRKMKLWEVLITFGVGIAIGIVVFGIEIFAIWVAVSHVGHDIFASLGYFF